MSFFIKDTRAQGGGEAYMVGIRRIKDPMGRDCEAADFGDRANARSFTKSEAEQRCHMLNQIAKSKQFVVEEESVLNMQYRRPRAAANGFMGVRQEPQPQAAGGFRFTPGSNYNGF